MIWNERIKQLHLKEGLTLKEVALRPTKIKPHRIAVLQGL